jgi:hypothetical protein
MEQHLGGTLLWLQLLQDREIGLTKNPLGEPFPVEDPIKSFHINPNGKTGMERQ